MRYGFFGISNTNGSAALCSNCPWIHLDQSHYFSNGQSCFAFVPSTSLRESCTSSIRFPQRCTVKTQSLLINETNEKKCFEFSFFRKSSADTTIAIFATFRQTNNHCKRSNSDFWNTFWFFYHPYFLSVICVSYYYWLELLKTTTTTINIEQNQKRKNA